MAEEIVDHRASSIVNDYLDDNRFCIHKIGEILHSLC